jgi:hypothetical protein
VKRQKRKLPGLLNNNLKVLMVITGMDLLGGVHTPPSPEQGGAIFHDKAKNY